MGDVWASCRGPKVTSLLWALHNDGAILVLPRHVVTETIERLHRRSRADGDVAVARDRLAKLYLPLALVVDKVPDDWGAGDPRVEALAIRDRSDLPTARLAVALAPCYLLAEDPDVCTPGLGVSKWLPVAHAASNDAEFTKAMLAARIPAILASEGVKAATRAVSRAPQKVQAALLVTLLTATWWLTSTPRGRRISERVTAPIGGVVKAVGPPLLQIVERDIEGRVVLRNQLVIPAARTSLSEAVASVLAAHATHDEPMLADEVARHLESCGHLREHTASVRSVRSVLRAHPETFTEVARSRFSLGRPLSLPRYDLDAAEVRDFLRRSHRDVFDLVDPPAWTRDHA